MKSVSPFGKIGFTDNTTKRVFKESYDAAQEFFSVWQKEFLPALRANDKTKLQELLQGSMKEFYNLHRTKIDELVSLRTQANETITKALTDLGQRLHLFSDISWVATILLGILIAALINYSITTRLREFLSKIGAATQEIDTSMQSQNQLIANNRLRLIKPRALWKR